MDSLSLSLSLCLSGDEVGPSQESGSVGRGSLTFNSKWIWNDFLTARYNLFMHSSLAKDILLNI